MELLPLNMVCGATSDKLSVSFVVFKNNRPGVMMYTCDLLFLNKKNSTHREGELKITEDSFKTKLQQSYSLPLGNRIPGFLSVKT